MPVREVDPQCRTVFVGALHRHPNHQRIAPDDLRIDGGKILTGRIGGGALRLESRRSLEPAFPPLNFTIVVHATRYSNVSPAAMHARRTGPAY